MNKGAVGVVGVLIAAVLIFAAVWVWLPEQGGHDHHDDDHDGPVDVEFTLYAYLDGYKDEAGNVNPTLEVAAGDVVKIILINGQSLEHNIVVMDGETQLAHSDHVGDGETTSIVFTAPDCACTLIYVCMIEGHQDAGMEGFVIVEEHDEHGH